MTAGSSGAGSSGEPLDTATLRAHAADWALDSGYLRNDLDDAADALDALRAENARLRMDLTDWQEQAEIRSLGVQMASEQRDQVIAVANERADEIDNLRSENARLTAEVADQRMVIASHRDVLHLRKEQINAADGFTAQAAQRALDAAARAAAAEARLAAVLALCDLSPHYLATDQVRAAARGESDQ